MRVLGLDIATKIGAALVDDSASVINASTITAAGEGHERLEALVGKVTNLLDVHAPHAVVVEDYGFANKHSLVKIVEVASLVRHELWLRGYAYTAVAPNALKKFVTGSGSAKKDQIMLQVYKRWGFEAATDDEADAFGLAAIGLAKSGALAPVTKAQQEVIDRLPPVAINCTNPTSGAGSRTCTKEGT